MTGMVLEVGGPGVRVKRRQSPCVRPVQRGALRKRLVASGAPLTAAGWMSAGNGPGDCRALGSALHGAAQAWTPLCAL